MSTRKKRTRSVARAEEFEFLSSMMVSVLPVLVQEDWLDTKDVCTMSLTCSRARDIWCNDDDTIWKSLAKQTWSNLDELVVVKSNDNHDRDDSSLTIVETDISIESYKSLLADPLLWLTVSAARVKTLPKWSKPMHFEVECGKCGCNCNNDMECQGIPITSPFRWEKDEKLNWPEDREGVPDGEGDKMSGGTTICVNTFCEPCFERLVELKIISHNDYSRKAGQNLYDIVLEEIVSAKTEKENRASKEKDGARLQDGSPIYYVPFFRNGSEWSWQKMNNDVEADDIAIVVANALIQEGCSTRHLQLDGIHYNDPGFAHKGYKALAYALAFNTTVERIDFYFDWGDGCECCYDTDTFSYHVNLSNGLFLKAFQNNAGSALKELPFLCPTAFGPATMQAWKQAKPGLKCGPTLYWDSYHDLHEEAFGFDAYDY